MISGSISFITRPSGGLGIRSAEMLAPSAHLAAAASTLCLLQSVLPDSIWMQGDQSATSTETIIDRPGQLTNTLSANITHPKSLGWTSRSKSKGPNPYQSSI